MSFLTIIRTVVLFLVLGLPLIGYIRLKKTKKSVDEALEEEQILEKYLKMRMAYILGRRIQTIVLIIFLRMLSAIPIPPGVLEEADGRRSANHSNRIIHHDYSISHGVFY